MTTIMIAMTTWASFSSQPAQAARADTDDKAAIRQDVSIRSKGAGPVLRLPPPGPDKAVVGEVIASLDIMRRDHSLRASPLAASGLSKRLNRPFPVPPFLSFSPHSVNAPYDTWVFEVISKGELIWRQDGAGRVEERLDWDGTGTAGEFSARVDQTYYFRFTGRRGAETFSVVSDPVTLKSLAFRETLGAMRLEVASRHLFKAATGAFSPTAGDFLKPLGDRLRRAGGSLPYKLEVYDSSGEAATAKKKASALRRWFADYLVINPAQIEVDVVTSAGRGEAVACILPAERGEKFKIE